MIESGSRSRKGWALASPALLWITLFFTAPMALVVTTSLWRRVGGSIDRTPSLDNYRRILTDETLLSSLVNSLEVTFVTIVVSLLVAYPAAYILAYRVPVRRQRILLLLAVLPFWTSYLVRSYSWLLVLARNGVVNTTLTRIGLIGEPLSLSNSRTATVIGFVHFFVMLTTLTIYASLTQIPESYRNAARDLGASPTSAFLRVTLPLSLPGMVVGGFLTFVLAFGDYITPQILGGGNELLLPQAIMLQVQRRGDFPLAAALGVVLILVVGAAYGLSARRLSLEGSR